MQNTFPQSPISSDSSINFQETTPLIEQSNQKSTMALTIGKVMIIIGGIKSSLGTLGAAVTITVGLFQNYNIHSLKMKYPLITEALSITVGVIEMAIGNIIIRYNKKNHYLPPITDS